MTQMGSSDVSNRVTSGCRMVLVNVKIRFGSSTRYDGVGWT